MGLRHCLIGISLLFSLTQGILAETPDFPDHDIVMFDLSSDSEGTSLSNPQIVTDRVGYDNQPFFDRDSQGIFYTQIEEGNADIWRWSPFDRAPAWVETELSEYSPTVMPNDTGTLSTVRVEKDEAQRLWSYSGELGFELLFDTVKPVGYHAWSGNKIAMFVLGAPHQLRVGELGQESTKMVDSDIGRCLQKIPGHHTVSYTKVQEERHRLMTYDFSSQQTTQGRLLPGTSQDYVWLDSKTVITSNGETLMLGDAISGTAWIPMTFPQGLRFADITRLAISPDKKKIAIVYVKSK